MRGIGTCYREKAGRFHAIRMGDLVRPDTFTTAGAVLAGQAIDLPVF